MAVKKASSKKGSNSENTETIKAWDSGVNDDGKYTIMLGQKAFIFGKNANEDIRNVEVISSIEIDQKWMDKNYKKVDVNSIRMSNHVADFIKSKCFVNL